MNLSELAFGFEAVRWIVISAIGIYAWVVGRQSASSREMLDLRTRITTLEAQMAQVPSQVQLHELITKIERVNGAVDATAKRIDPLCRSVERVENYLLNKK
jgi:hypothetical protein